MNSSVISVGFHKNGICVATTAAVGLFSGKETGPKKSPLRDLSDDAPRFAG